MKSTRRLFALALLAMAAPPAAAQIPPTERELLGYVGLHAAAANGDLAAIASLARNKAALAARDANGRTPLHVATFRKQRAAIRALVKAGAGTDALDRQKYDAVTIASVADDVETLRALLEIGASAQLTTSVYDGTALIAAAHLGHDEVVRLLIGAGAPLDHVNNLGWTAVIESIVLGDGGARHQATLRHLIEARASLAIADRQGKTPLALARERGYSAMVAMLERVGAR